MQYLGIPATQLISFLTVQLQENAFLHINVDYVCSILSLMRKFKVITHQKLLIKSSNPYDGVVRGKVCEQSKKKRVLSWSFCIISVCIVGHTSASSARSANSASSANS